MNFAIGETEYFNTLGFDTTHWRKSLDGTLAVVHYDFIKFVANESKLEIYTHDSEDFINLMNSEVWTEHEHIE